MAAIGFAGHRLGPWKLNLLRVAAARIAMVCAVAMVSLTVPAFADNTTLVRPLVGTARQGGSLAGNTFPGAVVPFGMVQFGPDTFDAYSSTGNTNSPNGLTDQGYSYSYADNTIYGFSLTHQSGTGIASYGAVRLMPTTGTVTNPEDYSSTFSHANETAAPGYYRVLLDRWGVNAECSATPRSGIANFTFPANVTPNVLLPISRTLTASSTAAVSINNVIEITGTITARTVKTQLYTIYFCVRFDQPMAHSAVWTDGVIDNVSRQAVQNSTADRIGAIATFAPKASAQTITARIGISFVDVEGARNNVFNELPPSVGFAGVHSAAQASWQSELGRVTASTRNPAQLQAFYTALYHCLLHPNIFDDFDGRYVGFDGSVYQAPSGHNIYANFSGWDIYRTEIPLLTLIEPDRVQDMAQSLVYVYEQTGWLGRWLQANQFTSSTVGTPFTPILSTLISSGLTNFDTATAYAAMMHEVSVAPPSGQGYLGEDGQQYMSTLGYVPLDKVTASVSKTLEYCYAYAALSFAANALQHSADASTMAAAALRYRNLYDSGTGFLQPRNKDGSWLSPFDPSVIAVSGNPYYEGTGWEYLWSAPHDVKGLIGLLGGDTAFCQLLDTFFATYFDATNEVDLQTPFYYMYAGEPWRTQTLVTKLQASYTASPDGLPGNDDCGAMSAWYVLTALGLYPVDPARGAFELTTPLVTSATLTVPGSTPLQILVASRGSRSTYVSGTALKGRRTRSWIPSMQLRAGGILQFTLTSLPSSTWGVSPDQRPLSLTP